MPVEPSLRIADGHDAGIFVVHRPPVDPLDERGGLGRRPCGQKGPMVLQQGFRDTQDLRRGFPLAQNDFGKSLPDRPVMIQRRESEVFERQRPELLERLRHRNLAASHRAQQSLKTLGIHACPFSGFATRSMRSLTAFLQDLPSKRTA